MLPNITSPVALSIILLSFLPFLRVFSPTAAQTDPNLHWASSHSNDQSGYYNWYVLTGENNDTYNPNAKKLHGVFSIYNAGGLFGHRYRYEGTAFGGGLSAGLVRPLSRRWNLEFELGLGVVWADWERYRCVNCGKRTGKGSGVYVTPTRTAVNLVYLF